MALLGSLNILLGMSALAVEAGAKRSNRALQTVREHAKHAGDSLKKMEGALDAIGLGRVSEGLASLRAPFGVAAAGAATLTALGGAAAAAGARGIKLAADYEQTEVAFTTMLGSASRAQSVLSGLTQFAAETPFEFPELADAAKNLSAFGVRADQLVPSLRAIGDVASGISQPIGEIAQIYGKVRTQGRLYGDDIMQLGGRGIPVIAELAKQFGVSESQVSKLVERGKVGFDNLQRAFVSLTAEGGRFHGMMEAQSQTLHGLASTLTDNVNLALRDFGKALIENTGLKEITKDLIDFTNGLRFAAPEIANLTAKYAEMAETVANFATLGLLKSSAEHLEAESARGAELDARIAAMNQRLSAQGLDRGVGEQGLEIETRDDTSAIEAVGKLNAKLQEEIDLYGLTGTAREIAALKGKGLTDAQLAETLALQRQHEALDAQAADAKALSDRYANLKSSIESFTASLDTQIATFGMGAREAKLYEMAMEGATEQELAAARAKSAQLDAMEKQKQAAEDAAKAQEQLRDRIIEETRTAFEQWEAARDKIYDLRDAGELDDETAGRALKQNDDRFDEAEKREKDRYGGDASREATHSQQALTAGSAEAYSAVIKFLNPRDQVQKKSLEELKAIRRQLFEDGKAERKKKSPAVVRRL